MFEVHLQQSVVPMRGYPHSVSRGKVPWLLGSHKDPTPNSHPG